MRTIGLLVAVLILWADTPAPAHTFGPPIQGLCLFSRAGAISASRAGQSMQAQVRQMQASLSGDLARQRAALDQQRRQLDTRETTIAPVEYQRQLTALNQQIQGLDRQQNARFIAAQQRAQQQIDWALNEALGRVVTRSACSVFIERDNAYGRNNSMDITNAAVGELDQLLQTVAVQ